MNCCASACAAKPTEWVAARAEPALTLLHNGACRPWLPEVKAIWARGRGRIRCTHIDAPDGDPSAHGEISCSKPMGRRCGLGANGRAINCGCFREYCRLMELGWLNVSVQEGGYSVK